MDLLVQRGLYGLGVVLCIRVLGFWHAVLVAVLALALASYPPARDTIDAFLGKGPASPLALHAKSRKVSHSHRRSSSFAENEVEIKVQHDEVRFAIERLLDFVQRDFVNDWFRRFIALSPDSAFPKHARSLLNSTANALVKAIVRQDVNESLIFLFHSAASNAIKELRRTDPDDDQLVIADIRRQSAEIIFAFAPRSAVGTPIVRSLLTEIVASLIHKSLLAIDADKVNLAIVAHLAPAVHKAKEEEDAILAPHIPLHTPTPRRHTPILDDAFSSTPSTRRPSIDIPRAHAYAESSISSSASARSSRPSSPTRISRPTTPGSVHSPPINYQVRQKPSHPTSPTIAHSPKQPMKRKSILDSIGGTIAHAGSKVMESLDKLDTKIDNALLPASSSPVMSSVGRAGNPPSTKSRRSSLAPSIASSTASEIRNEFGNPISKGNLESLLIAFSNRNDRETREAMTARLEAHLEQKGAIERFKASTSLGIPATQDERVRKVLLGEDDLSDAFQAFMEKSSPNECLPLSRLFVQIDTFEKVMVATNSSTREVINDGISVCKKAFSIINLEECDVGLREAFGVALLSLYKTPTAHSFSAVSTWILQDIKVHWFPKFLISQSTAATDNVIPVQTISMSFSSVPASLQQELQPLSPSLLPMSPQLPSAAPSFSITVTDVSPPAAYDAHDRYVKSKSDLEFLVAVESSSSALPGFIVVRKYSEMENLDSALAKLFGADTPTPKAVLPSLKYSTSEALVSLVTAYLETLLGDPRYASAEPVVRFFDKERAESKKGGLNLLDELGKVNRSLGKTGDIVSSGFTSFGKAVTRPLIIQRKSSTADKSAKTPVATPVTNPIDTIVEKATPTEEEAEPYHVPSTPPPPSDPVDIPQPSVDQTVGSPVDHAESIIKSAITPGSSPLQDRHHSQGKMTFDELLAMDKEAQVSSESADESPPEAPIPKKEVREMTPQEFNNVLAFAMAILEEMYRLESQFSIKRGILKILEAVLRTTYSDIIKTSFNSLAKSLVEPNFFAHQLTALLHIFWPPPTYTWSTARRPERTAAQKECTRQEARALFVEVAPQGLKMALGPGATQDAFGRLFDAMQCKEMEGVQVEGVRNVVRGVVADAVTLLLL